jgi:hypothetical protein
MAVTLGTTGVTFPDATIQTTAAVTSGFTGLSVITASGTFTIPVGKSVIKLTVVGGGGSGANNQGTPTGNVGGTTTVASGTQTISTISATGGGVMAAGSPAIGANGGTATGGDLNIRGGGAGGNTYMFDGVVYLSSGGGGSIFGSGGPGFSFSTAGLGVLDGVAYGSGGGGGNGGGGGGAGATAIKYLTGVTPGNTLTITIGAGGAALNLGPGYTGAGASGVVIVEY